MENNPPQTISITNQDRATLLVSVLVISVCALTYELIIATLSSYLLGNSVTQFSFTIGIFLFAMGIGSLLSRGIRSNEMRWFILVELVIGITGGLSAILLYAVFAATDIYYYTVMFTIIMIIGICSGLEIPLLTRIFAHWDDLGRTLANVLSIDYLGALLASLAFPIILLPALGVTLTAFLTGLFNICVAGINLIHFRTWVQKKWRRGLGFAVAASFLALGVGIGFSTTLTEIFEDQLYEDRIIFRDQTPYQRIVITRRGDDIRLFLDGNLQFSSRDEYRYHEMLVHPAMNLARSHEQVVVLGGGDGLVIRELLKYDDIQRIVLVDIDPEVTELAREYPLLRELNEAALDDPRVEIINQDAFTYIRDTDDLFPIAILDLPDPNNESLSKLYSSQFYQLLRKRLTPDGVFITQATSPYFARRAFWSIAETIEASGFTILPLRTYIPSFGDWGFVIGAAYDIRVPENILPAGSETDLHLRYLTAEVLDAARYFDSDTDQVPVNVNTLDNPILIRYYEDGWRYWD